LVDGDEVLDDAESWEPLDPVGEAPCVDAMPLPPVVPAARISWDWAEPGVTGGPSSGTWPVLSPDPVDDPAAGRIS